MYVRRSLNMRVFLAFLTLILYAKPSVTRLRICEFGWVTKNECSTFNITQNVNDYLHFLRDSTVDIPVICALATSTVKQQEFPGEDDSISSANRNIESPDKKGPVFFRLPKWAIIVIAIVVITMGVVEGCMRSGKPDKAIVLGRLGPSIAVLLTWSIVISWLRPTSGREFLLYTIYAGLVFFVIYTVPSIVIRRLLGW